MNRRRFLQLAAAGAASAAAGAYLAMPEDRTPPPDAGPAIRTLDLGRIRVHALRTGWVRVKRAHAALAGLAATRMLSIALDPRWTPWLPITCWVVEHPERTIAVDAGETHRVAEPGWFRCDPGTGLFYERMLRFRVAAEDEAGAQLRAAGIDPASVGAVVLTHLHSDHAGGLGDFPEARVLLSRTEWARRPAGALPCRWPPGFSPAAVECAPEPWGAFERSARLTRDGAVRIVPTPGHTHGHQSVVIEADGRWVVLAGDASFDVDQVRAGAAAGICADVGAARATLETLRRQIRGFPTVYLPAHDPDGARRLAAAEVSEG